MYNKKVLSKIDLGKQTKKDPFKGDIIYDSMGQWKFPGQPTRIPSNEITMEGVPYPVYGIDNTGYEQMMYPGANYTFPGNYVDEYPMAKKGGSLPKRPKKKNKKAWSRSIEATNILFTENPLFSQPKPRRNKVYDPNAKYFQEGGELPDDYQEFLDYSATAPENRQPGQGYFYGSPDEYDHYGMWEALGKPQNFEQALEMNPDWQQDEEGYYHGYSVNPYTGVFLKSGEPGLEEGDTKWMEIAEHYLSPRANESTPVYDTDLQRFKYVPNKQKGGTKSKSKRTKLPTLYISDPEEYRLRKAMYDDSLYMYQQNNSTKLPPPPKLEYDGPRGGSKHSPVKVTTNPIKKITDKNDTKKALLYSKAFPGDSPAFKNYQKKTGKKLPANLPMWIEKQTALYYPNYHYSNTNPTGKGFVPPGKDYVKEHQYRGLWKEPRQPVMFGEPESSVVTSTTYDKYPPIYVSDSNDPRIGMYTEAGNQILYKKPVTSKKNALKLKPKVAESKIPISESAPVSTQVPVQTENVLPIQKPLRDKMIMPLGRSYNNEATDGSLEGGKTTYGQFEKVVDPRTGKIRYLPTGKKSNFITLEDPTFKQGGYIDLELTPEEIEQYRQGGYIVEELSKAQSGLSQNKSKKVTTLPEIKVTPNLKKRLNLTGRPEYAKGYYDPYGVSDNTLENIVEIVDPTGMSSWDDIARSYRKSGMSPETALEVFGAIPLLGKLSKLTKQGIHLTKHKGLDKMLYDFLPKSKSVSNTLSKAATAGRATDIYQTVDEWFKRKGGYIVEDISVPTLTQAQKGGESSCPEGYIYDSANNTCIPTGEFEYIDNPNDARLQDYKMQDILYRYSQLPYKHKENLTAEDILSGDLNTSWNERLNDPYLSNEEKALLKNDLLDWEGSKAQVWNFNDKKQLQNFINSSAFTWAPNLDYKWKNDEELTGLIKKYPPTGYHAREYFSSYPYTDKYAYNQNVPNKSGYNHYVTPKTAFIEDEIDREKLKKIYPTLTDEEIDGHLKETREQPSYITNYLQAPHYYWNINNHDIEYREDQAYPLVERITPEEISNSHNPWQYQGLPKKGADSYLQESEIDNIQYQGDYIPTWSAPKKRYILRGAVPKPVVSESIQTEDVTSTQMPLKDKMVLPLGRHYFNENTNKGLQGGKTYYGEFEKIVDKGKVRYVPTGKKKEFITLEDPTFQSGGAKSYITDPKEYKYRKAMYDDSLNLYKAYQFQKRNINPKPRVKDFVDMYNKTSREYPELRRPGQPKTMTIEQMMKERKTNFNKRLPKYTHKDYLAVKKNSRGDFDPMDKRAGDYKIQGYYKSLPFNYDVAIGVHSSPDIWHSKINPSGSYFDGIAYSPKYKKPVEPVEFGESEFIESKPVLPKQVISESVQTENMLPVQIPLRDKMIMPLGRWYNNEATDGSLEGGQEYYGEFEKIIDPSSGKVRYVPTGKKSKFRTLYNPTFQDGGEMYDASDLTPFIKAQTGLVATGEEDLYSAGELEPVTVKAEMPDWARFQEEYQNIKPLESYIAEEKKKYLRRGNKALNKMAGVTETNFPKDVEERFRQEYNQKMNTYATRKLGKKQGFNPRRRGEWVDELSPREFDVVAQSNYGSKLQPSVWTRTLSGLRSAYNVLPGPDMLTPIAGMTERENREALTNPLEGLEVFAPTDLPGIAIANVATNANPNIVKPNPFSGETMANVNPLATVGLNPLTIVDLAALPGLASGIYRGTKAAGKALEKGSRAGVRMAGNTLKKFVDERKYSKYKPEFATLEDVPTEDELKRLSEIEKAASVKTYNFKKTSPPQLDFYNTYDEYLNAVDEFNQNLKTVKNYVNKSTLPDEDIENIFGIGKKQILNAKEAQPVPNAPAVQSPFMSVRSARDQREREVLDMMQAAMQPETTRTDTAAFRNTLNSLISDTEAVNLNTQEYQELDNLYRELVNEINTNPNAYTNEDYNDLNQLYRNLNRNYDNLYNVSNDISELSPDVIQTPTPTENARTLSQGVESLVRNVDDKVNEPVSATDIRTGMEQKREMPALSPNERLNVKALVPSLFANDFKNPREMLKFVTNKLDEGIKDAEVGDIITGSANTSHDSYLIQMDYIFKNAGKDGLSEPVFLGYEPMNTMGFLSKTKGVNSDDIYKKINAHLNNLQKRTGKSLNLKTHPPMITDDPVTGPMIMIPQYGLKKVSTNVGKLKKKKEGGIVSELSQKEINDLIAQGYIIEEV
jgi:hypothetical protein